MPEFRCDIDLKQGAAELFDDAKKRGAWRDSTTDQQYQGIVDEAA